MHNFLEKCQRNAAASLKSFDKAQTAAAAQKALLDDDNNILAAAQMFAAKSPEEQKKRLCTFWNCVRSGTTQNGFFTPKNTPWDPETLEFIPSYLPTTEDRMLLAALRRPALDVLSLWFEVIAEDCQRLLSTKQRIVFAEHISRALYSVEWSKIEQQERLSADKAEIYTKESALVDRAAEQFGISL